MKKLFLIVAIMGLVGTVSCQNYDDINGMILNSIQMYNVNHPKSYICKDGLPPDFPFECFDTCRFVSLHDIRIEPLYKRKALRKGVELARVRFRMEGNRFYVKIVRYDCTWLRRLRKTFSMGLCYSMEYEYLYSCEEQKWKLVSKND